MKTKTLLSLAALAAFSIAGAQTYYFDFELLDSSTNVTGMSVKGKIDWDGTFDVAFEVTNSSDYTSQVTEFYILKPLDNAGYKVNAASLDSPVDATSDWNLANELQQDTYTYVDGFSGLAKTDYFGVTLHPPGSSEGIDQAETQSFSFTMVDPNPASIAGWDDFGNTAGSKPHIVVRWQSIGDDEEASAMGYGYWTPDFEPVVPEPSQIAALAMVGLGGLLFARRRLTRKQK